MLMVNNLMVRVVFFLQMASELHMDSHSWKEKIHLPKINQELLSHHLLKVLRTLGHGVLVCYLHRLTLGI